MSIASDVTEGHFILHMVGDGILCLENYRSILEYSNECIEVEAKNHRIRIEGINLRVAYYGAVEMKVTGIIHNIQIDR